MNKITIQDGNDARTVVYVNWRDEEILSEVEYEARLEEETNIAATDDYYFNEWLNKYYTAAEIWNMSEEEKEKANSYWLRDCRKNMEVELGYERREL